MGILDLQKRARELGRIRTGNKGDRGQPQKLGKFRLTSASQPLLERVAELYGGTVRQWDNNGLPQWEVYTESDRLPIIVPPQPVSQWLETWSAGGCQHRCDGQFDQISGEACDNSSRLHQQAKPTTRLKVILRDVEGLGVWRLESHGWNAAVELPEVAELLAQAGGYINGTLGLEERIQKAKGDDGKPVTRRYMVPVIEVDVTPAQLLAGQGRITPPAIAGPVAAIEQAGVNGTSYVELLASASTPDEVNAVWHHAKEAGRLDQQLADQIKAAADRVRETAPALERPADSDQPDADGAYPAQIVDDGTQAPKPDEVPADVDAAYQACVAAAGELGMNLWTMEGEFEQGANMPMGDATAHQLAQFAKHLRAKKESA